MKNDIQTALDRLFRAHFELAATGRQEDMDAVHWYEPEMHELAKATGFDRTEATPRWIRELDAEAIEVRNRYEGARVLSALRTEAAARYATLVGKDVRGLWKDTER